jgi:hypothetical protein
MMGTFEEIPVTIKHDPLINLRPDLLDHIMKWLINGLQQHGLESAEGGFCLHGISYRVAYGPSDDGKIDVIVLLEHGGSIEPPSPSPANII